jgi:hypothetical protein
MIRLLMSKRWLVIGVALLPLAGVIVEVAATGHLAAGMAVLHREFIAGGYRLC